MVSESTDLRADPVNRGSAHRWLRLAALALIVVLLGMALIVWIIGTSSGARASLRLLNLMTGGQIQATDVQGSFARQLRIGHLSIVTKDSRIMVRHAQLDWKPLALRHRLLHIDALHMEELVIQTSKQAVPEPRRLPASLQLPVQLMIDRFHVDHLSLRQDDQDLATIEALRLRWRFDTKTHVLNVQSAQLTLLNRQRADGHLTANLHLQASKPYAIHSDVQLRGQQGEWQLQGKGNIRGLLTDMTAQLVLSFGQHPMQAHLTGLAQLRPFSDQIISAGELKTEGLDLASIQPHWPTTRINGRVSFTSHQNGKFLFRNTLPGTLDKSRLPVTQVSGLLRLQGDSLTLEDLHINQNTLTGGIKKQQGQWQMSLRTNQLNLKQIDSRLRATRLDGKVYLIQASDKTTLHIALSEPVKTRALHIRADAFLEKSVLTMRSAQLSLGNAVVDISGQVGLSGLQTVVAQGRVQHLRLADLGTFESLPDIVLNGRFDLTGQRQPSLQLALDFSVADSLIEGHPFYGKGQMQLDARSLKISDLELRAGDNLLQVHGEMNEHQGDLKLMLKASQLSQLGREFAGQLTMEASVSGNLKQPILVARWQAHALRLPGKFSVRDAQGRLQLSQAVTAPLSLHARFQEAVVAGTPLRSLQIDLDGKPEAHTLSVRLAHGSSRLDLSATGGLDTVSPDGTWRGQILKANLHGEISATLEQRANVEWSKDDLQLSHIHLSSRVGRVVIAHLRRDRLGIVSRGHLEQLHVGRLAAAAQYAPLTQSDLQLEGEWHVSLLRQGRQNTEGLISLRRTRGDLRFSATQTMALQLQQLEATLQLSEERLSFRLEARGNQLGTLSFAGGTRLRNGQLLPQATAPIDGVLKASLPTLSFMGPLLSPGLITAGRMEAQVSVTGQLSSPTLAGTLSAERLHLHWLDNGLALNDGRLQADFNGDRIQLRQLSFAGSRDSTGRISVTGPIQFIEGGPESDLRWRATQFSLFDRSDRQLVLTGSGQLQTLARSARLRGELVVDRGFIDLGREEMPQLSDDVIVIGKPPPNTPTLALDMDLGIGLGEKLSVRGRGIDARLGGSLRLNSTPGEALSASGLMQVTRGTYTAYGRELMIERGVLRFDGPPGNPALDIRAMRRGTEVAPGVMITGTVMAPRIRLISEPQVPDAEKLSWLVLGQGLSGTTDKQAGALQEAAASLLTQSAAAGIQAQIATHLGLDSITLSRRPDNVQQRIITLGKRVSSRLYVSYQQGLQAAGSVVLLRYTLSPRVTVEAETGTRSVFSLFYNFSFD